MRGIPITSFITASNYQETMEGLALALLVCLILALVAKKFTLPPIPFYILSGVALGGSGFALVQADELSQFLSFLGLIFLLFYVGLEMKPRRFIGQGPSILISGLLDLNINMAIGFFAALVLGFGTYEAFIIGSAFYISSSAMAVASLIENKKLIHPEAETIVWMMIFEDVLLILLLSVISVEASSPLFLAVKIVAMVSAFYILIWLGRSLFEGILHRDDELPVLFTFTAVLAAAFVARFAKIPEALSVIALGSALSQTNTAVLERLSQPFRDVFLVLFFVFFGISVQLGGDLHLIPIIVITTLAIASKLISALLMGKSLHGSLASGIEIWANTIGRGEFSIALAALYGSAVVTTTIAVMVIVSSIIGSFTARYSGQIIRAAGP
ncbi:MAG: cation:proton antiporter [Methanomicrobiales archaeon]|nr:cation:proton antiporter [Methanomicrobiales archaeon]